MTEEEEKDKVTNEPLKPVSRVQMRAIDGEYKIKYSDVKGGTLDTEWTTLNNELKRFFGYENWAEYKKDNAADLKATADKKATVHPLHVAYSFDEYRDNFDPGDYVLVGIPSESEANSIPSVVYIKNIVAKRKMFFGPEGSLVQKLKNPEEGLANKAIIDKLRNQFGFSSFLEDNLSKVPMAVQHPDCAKAMGGEIVPAGGLPGEVVNKWRGIKEAAEPIYWLKGASNYGHVTYSETSKLNDWTSGDAAKIPDWKPATLVKTGNAGLENSAMLKEAAERRDDTETSMANARDAARKDKEHGVRKKPISQKKQDIPVNPKTGEAAGPALPAPDPTAGMAQNPDDAREQDPYNTTMEDFYNAYPITQAKCTPNMKPGECEQHTKNRQLLLTTLWESFKVIDVTGISSWGDVQDNILLFMDDPNTETGLYALVSLLAAVPIIAPVGRAARIANLAEEVKKLEVKAAKLAATGSKFSTKLGPIGRQIAKRFENRAARLSQKAAEAKRIVDIEALARVYDEEALLLDKAVLTSRPGPVRDNTRKLALEARREARRLRKATPVSGARAKIAAPKTKIGKKAVKAVLAAKLAKAMGMRQAGQRLGLRDFDISIDGLDIYLLPREWYKPNNWLTEKERMLAIRNAANFRIPLPQESKTKLQEPKLEPATQKMQQDLKRKDADVTSTGRPVENAPEGDLHPDFEALETGPVVASGAPRDWTPNTQDGYSRDGIYVIDKNKRAVLVQLDEEGVRFRPVTSEEAAQYKAKREEAEQAAAPEEEVPPTEAEPIEGEQTLEKSKVLIFGHSQAGRFRYGGRLERQIKTAGGEVERENHVHSSQPDGKVGSRPGLVSFIKKIEGQYTHAYLFLGGNTVADGKLFANEKKDIINHVTDVLGVPKENILVILPPINTDNEFSNSRQSLNVKATKIFDSLGVKTHPPIIGGGENFAKDGKHIDRNSPLAKDGVSNMVGTFSAKAPVLEGGRVDPKEMYDYLVAKPNVTSNHAIGIINNIRHESGFKPGAQGDHTDNTVQYDSWRNQWQQGYVRRKKGGWVYAHKKNPKYGQPVPEKNVKNIKPNGGGLVGFLNVFFKDMVSYVGDDWTQDWKGQLNFALSSRNGRKYLEKTFSSPEKASEDFTINFEKPMNKEVQAKKRLRTIDQYKEFTLSKDKPEEKPEEFVDPPVIPAETAGESKLEDYARVAAYQNPNESQDKREQRYKIIADLDRKLPGRETQGRKAPERPKQKELYGNLLSKIKDNKQVREEINSDTLALLDRFGDGEIEEQNPAAWGTLGVLWAWTKIGVNQNTSTKVSNFAAAGLIDNLFRGWNQAKHKTLERGGPINAETGKRRRGSGQYYYGKKVTKNDLEQFYKYNTRKYKLKELPYGSLDKYIQDFAGKVIPVPYGSHWSAVTIQYMMRADPDFTEHSRKGGAQGQYKGGKKKGNVMGHASYIGQGKAEYWSLLKDRKNIKSGQKQIDPATYITITTKQAAKLKYEPQIGDLIIAPNGHGDVVTTRGRVGGNLGRSIRSRSDGGVTRAQNKKAKQIVTKSMFVKRKLLGLPGEPSIDLASAKPPEISESKDLINLFKIIEEINNELV
jgi:hypothetical protein